MVSIYSYRWRNIAKQYFADASIGCHLPWHYILLPNLKLITLIPVIIKKSVLKMFQIDEMFRDWYWNSGIDNNLALLWYVHGYSELIAA